MVCRGQYFSLLSLRTAGRHFIRMLERKSGFNTALTATSSLFHLRRMNSRDLNIKYTQVPETLCQQELELTTSQHLQCHPTISQRSSHSFSTSWELRPRFLQLSLHTEASNNFSPSVSLNHGDLEAICRLIPVCSCECFGTSPTVHSKAFFLRCDCIIVDY